MAGAKDRDDGHTHAMLYEGASMSQLARLFGMDMRDVSKKVNLIPPCGERRGFPIWNVREAAEVLIPPRVTDEQILSYIVGMNFKDLPPSLNKEVWNGLRARLRFEEEQGDLWPTDRVATILNSLMQTFRMGMLLLPDRLNQADSLSPRQREQAEKIADAVLFDMQQQIEQAMRQLDTLTSGIMDYAGEGQDDATDESEKGASTDGLSEAAEEDFDL